MFVPTVVVPLFVVTVIVPVFVVAPPIWAYSVVSGVQLKLVDPPLEISVICPVAEPTVYVTMSLNEESYRVILIEPADPIVNPAEGRDKTEAAGETGRL